MKVCTCSWQQLWFILSALIRSVFFEVIVIIRRKIIPDYHGKQVLAAPPPAPSAAPLSAAALVLLFFLEKGRQERWLWGSCRSCAPVRGCGDRRDWSSTGWFRVFKACTNPSERPPAGWEAILFQPGAPPQPRRTWLFRIICWVRNHD